MRQRKRPLASGSSTQFRAINPGGELAPFANTSRNLAKKTVIPSSDWPARIASWHAIFGGGRGEGGSSDRQWGWISELKRPATDALREERDDWSSSLSRSDDAGAPEDGIIGGSIKLRHFISGPPSQQRQCRAFTTFLSKNRQALESPRRGKRAPVPVRRYLQCYSSHHYRVNCEWWRCLLFSASIDPEHGPRGAEDRGELRPRVRQVF